MACQWRHIRALLLLLMQVACITSVDVGLDLSSRIALSELVDKLREAMANNEEGKIHMILGQIEAMSSVDNAMDDIKQASEDVEELQNEGEAALQKVAGLFNFNLQSLDFDKPNVPETSNKEHLRSKGKSTKRRDHSKSCAKDKKEVAELKTALAQAKLHQAIEVEKLMAVKKGVESLVRSLNGTKSSLIKAKKESSEVKLELGMLHDQAHAAAQLQQDISDIQNIARVNYETGQVELSVSGQLKTIDQITEVHKSHSDFSNEALLLKQSAAHLADPAILHADLTLLIDIVLLIGAAAVGGMLAAVVKMPPIIGYILGGVAVGPSGWDLIRTVVQVETLAQFGSVFFLFAHGIEYSIKDQSQFQTVSLGGCLLSTAVSSVCMQLYTLWSGLVYTPLEGGVLGLSLSLSSLSIILDYLHEQKLLQSTHGKVMMGMLFSQGLMMGLLFSIPPVLAGEISIGGVAFALARAAFGIAFIGFLALRCGKLVVPVVLNFMLRQTKKDELFLLGVVSIAMGVALLTEYMGLSLDLGAFLAGLMIAGTPFMDRTSVAIQPLATMFAAMLFASIGMIMNPRFFYLNFFQIMMISLQIIVVKFLVITLVVRLFNYSWRTSIVSGIGLSHVGEFSLLFSSKLQAHNLLSRRAYLLFLASTVTTLVLAPLILRMLKFVVPRLMYFIGSNSASSRESHKRKQANSFVRFDSSADAKTLN